MCVCVCVCVCTRAHARTEYVSSTHQQTEYIRFFRINFNNIFYELKKIE